MNQLQVSNKGNQFSPAVRSDSQTYQQRKDFRVFVDFGRLNVHEMDVQALNLCLEV